MDNKEKAYMEGKIVGIGIGRRLEWEAKKKMLLSDEIISKVVEENQVEETLVSIKQYLRIMEKAIKEVGKNG